MISKEEQIKNSFLYLFPAIIGTLIPFLTLPVFTRILTKEDYGVFALCQFYAAFVNGIANFCLTYGFERNFFEHKEVKNVAGLLYSTLAFVIIASTILGFLTYTFRQQLSHLIIGSSEFGSLLFWTYCSLGITGLKNYYLIFYKNSENAKPFVLYTIVESIMAALISLFMVAYLRIGVIGLIWGQLWAGLIIFSILSFQFVRMLPVSIEREALWDSLKISSPLTPRIFFGVLGNQFDKYLIGLLGTVGGVGIYNIGQRVAYIVFYYMTAIQNVFSPQVYRRMFDLGEEGKASIGRYLTPFLYTSILIGLLISLFSEELTAVLTPESYHDAIDIIIIFSMLYGSYFFSKQPQLIYMKKTYISSIINIFNIGINVAINIPFILRWGAIGAAWGTLLSGLISGSILFFISQHFYHIKWEYGKVLSIFIIFFGSSIAMIVMRNFGISYEIRAIFKTVSLALYLYLGIVFNILSKKNYLLIRSIMITTKNGAHL